MCFEHLEIVNGFEGFEGFHRLLFFCKFLMPKIFLLIIFIFIIHEFYAIFFLFFSFIRILVKRWHFFLIVSWFHDFSLWRSRRPRRCNRFFRWSIRKIRKPTQSSSQKFFRHQWASLHGCILLHSYTSSHFSLLNTLDTTWRLWILTFSDDFLDLL